jgi:hypothetical protein
MSKRTPSPRRSDYEHTGEWARSAAQQLDASAHRHLRAVPPAPQYLPSGADQPIEAPPHAHVVDEALNASVMIDLRQQMLHRMLRMNAAHARHAWDNRNRQRIGPIAFAFFFSMADRTLPDRLRLFTDTRLYLDEKVARQPERMLATMCQQIYVALAEEGKSLLDIRSLLVNSTDKDWPAGHPVPPGLGGPGSAQFVGVGVSSLDTSSLSTGPRDTEHGTWDEIMQSVEEVTEIPGLCLIQGTDGNRILVGRSPVARFTNNLVYSTGNLTPRGDMMPMRWVHNPELNNLAENDPNRATWHYLSELVRIVHWGWR